MNPSALYGEVPPGRIGRKRIGAVAECQLRKAPHCSNTEGRRRCRRRRESSSAMPTCRGWGIGISRRWIVPRRVGNHHGTVDETCRGRAVQDGYRPPTLKIEHTLFEFHGVNWVHTSGHLRVALSGFPSRPARLRCDSRTARRLRPARRR